MTENMAFTPLTDDDELLLPSDTSQLDARADEIASNFVNTHVERVELAAICHLRRHGRITGTKMNKLAAKSAHLEGVLMYDSADFDTLKPVYKDGMLAWMNLELLVDGQPVCFAKRPEPASYVHYCESDANADEAWCKARRKRASVWFKTVMADLEQLMRSDQIYIFEAADCLPDNLLREVNSLAACKYFDGLYGVGASLHSQPSASAYGLGKPGTDAGVLVADALACALLYSIESLDAAASREADEDHAIVGQHVYMWWGLLKGYAYSGALSTTLPAMLGRNPRMLENVIVALDEGLAALQRHNVSHSIWRDGKYELAMAIEETPIHQVLADLQAAIEKGKAFQRTIR